MKNNPTKYLQSLGYGCLLWASVSLFPTCSDEPHEPDSVVNEPYKVMVISDLHLFDMERIGHEGEAWLKRLEREDKDYTYCAAIMEEIARRVKEQQVKYVIVPGDLTKDGEVINHEFAAACFQTIEEAGAQVFVINGNHDLSNADSKTFTLEGEFPIETATSADFLRIYHDYGYDHAVSQEADGLSYSVNMGEDIRLILMDSNIYNDSKTDPHQETRGVLKASTLAWAKTQCAEALNEGRVPIGVLHHGMVEHIPNIQATWLPEYLADNYIEAREALAEAGMHIVLTGHQHAQDIASVEVQGAPFYDIQTGSIVSLCPVRYMEVNPGTHTLQISSMVISQLPNDVALSELLEKNCSDGTRRYFVVLFTQYLQSKGFAGEQLKIMMQTIKGLPVAANGQYTLLDAMTDAFMTFRRGDEEADTYTSDVRTSLKSYAEVMQQAGNAELAQALLLIESLYAGFYVDSPSADNTLGISLNSD